MDFAFSFIIRNGGLDTEKDYKYKAADGVCNVNKEKRHVVTIDSYEDVPPNDESALKKVCFFHLSRPSASYFLGLLLSGEYRLVQGRFLNDKGALKKACCSLAKHAPICLPIPCCVFMRL